MTKIRIKKVSAVYLGLLCVSIIFIATHSLNSSNTALENEKGKHDEGLGEDDDLFLFVFVHSKVTNLARRSTVRMTWGDPGRYPNHKIQVFFFVGKLPSPSPRLIQEQKIHNDLVFLPLTEDYKNISLKARASVRYVVEHWTSARYVMKIDDDIVVDMQSVLTFLTSQHLVESSLVPVTFDDALICHVWEKSLPFREKKHKWYISRERFAPDVYPPFCSGSAWMTTLPALTKIHNALSRESFFPFDDVLVTGFAAKAAGLKHVDIKRSYDVLAPSMFTDLDSFLVNPKPINSDIVFFHVPSADVFQYVWDEITVRNHPTMNILAVYTSGSDKAN